MVFGIESRKHKLIKELKAHDYATYKHSQRVERLTYKFGIYLGYQGEDLRLLHEAAKFHDIGKLYIDKKILLNDDKLTDEEFEEIKKHTIYGEKILKDLNAPDEILKAVRGHHENYNGTGYPDNLKSQDISQGAEIIRIIDSYDSMVSDRPYSGSMPKETVLEELLSLKGILYNPNLVDRFLEYMEDERMVEI